MTRISRRCETFIVAVGGVENSFPYSLRRWKVLYCTNDPRYASGCNRLYLVFLKPILSEVQHLNTSFQSGKIDAGSLYVQISLVFLSFAGQILKPTFLRTAHTSSIQQIIDAVGNDLLAGYRNGFWTRIQEGNREISNFRGKQISNTAEVF